MSVIKWDITVVHIVDHINNMNQDIKDIVIDVLEPRLESHIQAQNKLHEDLHNKLIKAVEEKIDAKVNGKIDRIKEQLDRQDKILSSLDTRIKPFEEGVSWFTRAKSGAGWVAGFLTSIALIGGSIMWLIDRIRQ